MSKNKQMIKPDGENNIFLSNLVEYFGFISEEMREYLNARQEEDATVTLIDDYFPFKYNNLDDFLDHFDEIKREQENYYKELSEE